MGFIFTKFIHTRAAIVSRRYSDWSLRSKLTVAIIPPVILILLFAGLAYSWFFSDFVSTAMERSYRMQCLAQADEIEKILEKCRIELIYLSKKQITIEDAKAFLEYHNQTGGNIYREVGYIGLEDYHRFLLWNTGTSILDIQPDQWQEMKPNPMVLFENLRLLEPDHVYISDIYEIFYPIPQNQNGNSTSSVVIRMAVPCTKEDGKPEGLIFFGIDMVYLRNILSLYNSAKSPLYAFPQSPELRNSYLFDMQGWMLFQSENMDDPHTRLSTLRIRKGFTGISGKPDFKSAFLPDTENQIYWKMVTAVRSGNHSLLRTDQKGLKTMIMGDSFSLVYAPVPFRSQAGREPEIIFGLAYLDRSRLTLPELIQLRYFLLLVMISVIIVTITAIHILSVTVFKTAGKKDYPDSGTNILRPVYGDDALCSKQEISVAENTKDQMTSLPPELVDGLIRRSRVKQKEGEKEKVMPGEKRPEFGMGDLRTTGMGAAEMVEIRQILVKESPNIPDATPPVRKGNQGRSTSTGRMDGLPDGLSKRQQIIFPFILENGGITRHEYQELLGDGFPIRAAQYDLEKMVKKGYVKKIGKGQSAHYYPTGSTLFGIENPGRKVYPETS